MHQTHRDADARQQADAVLEAQKRAVAASEEAASIARRQHDAEVERQERYARSASELDAIDRAVRRMRKSSVSDEVYIELLAVRSLFATLASVDVDPAQRRSLADTDPA